MSLATYQADNLITTTSFQANGTTTIPSGATLNIASGGTLSLASGSSFLTLNTPLNGTTLSLTANSSSTQLTGSGAWTISSLELKGNVIANIVTIYVQGSSTNTASAAPVTLSAIPSTFWPLNPQYFYISGVVDTTITSLMVTLNTVGVLVIGPTTYSSGVFSPGNFTVSDAAAFPTFIITYQNN